MLDAKEEQRISELRRLGQELHLPVLAALWTFEVRDKEGRLIQRHQQRSHSWVRNAYNHLFSNMCAKNATGISFGAGQVNFKTMAGVVRGATNQGSSIGSSTYEGATYGVRAPLATSAWGILVGSGTDAESFEDYALQTQIVHGTGSGQLSHVATGVHSVSYTAGTKTLQDELIRYFNNNSGAGIDVNEVGMFCYFVTPFAVSHESILFARDHLSATVTVANTGQLKVTYTLELTYPA